MKWYLVVPLVIYSCAAESLDISGRWVNPDSSDVYWPLSYEFLLGGRLRLLRWDCSQVGLLNCDNPFLKVPIDTVLGQWQLKPLNGETQLCIATNEPIRCYPIRVIRVGTVEELVFGPPTDAPTAVTQALGSTMKTYRRAEK
jgi:hypothetical protein